MPYPYTPLTLPYAPDMLIMFREGTDSAVGIIPSGSAPGAFAGALVPVQRRNGTIHAVVKTNILRVGKRTFASSIEVDDVVLYKDGMTQEVTGVHSGGDDVALTFDGGGDDGDNVGRFDGSDYTLFVVVADTEA